MTPPEEQLKAFIELCAAAQLIDEAGKKVVYLPSMSFNVSGQINTQDLLFVPWPHSGYKNRLFYTNEIVGKAANWKQHNLLNRAWHSPSYNVDSGLSWRDQFLQHIKAVA